MANTEYADVELRVNGEQAISELDRLKKKSAEISKAMSQAYQLGDNKSGKQLANQLRKVDNEIRKMQSSTTNLDKVLRNLSGASVKDLNTALRQLQKQMNDGSIQRGSAEWNKYAENVAKVKAELENVKQQQGIIKKEGGLSSLFSGFADIWSGITMLGEIKEAVTTFFSGWKKVRDERDKGQHMLKALTGLDDDSIGWLTERAKKIATEMDETGLRVQQSATEILDAYMLVGSNKPELLTDKEALDNVTHEIMRLSTAAQMDLAEAVNATTTALNQFGASADETSRYVNVLAAGSKFGAANVQQQATVVLKAGAAAKTAGLQIEQLVGLTEALGEAGIKNEVAGTGLKTFLLRLETGAKETRPSVVGLQTALDNLAEHSNDATWLQKRFGSEAFSIAKTLIDSRDKVSDYTKSVTDTSVATEQAAINSDTFAARSKQLSNTLDDVYIELYQELSPAMSGFYVGMNSLISILPDVIRFFKEWGPTILSVVAPILAYNVAIAISNSRLVLQVIALKNYIATISLAAIRTNVFRVAKLAASAATALFTGNLTKATKAFKLMSAAMKANPIGLVVALLVAAAAATYKLLTATKELSVQEQASLAVKERLNKAEASDPNRKELETMQKLRATLLDSNASYNDRLEAINSLKKIMPGYTAELDAEGKIISENSQLFKEYTSYLENEAKWRAASQGVTETADKAEDKKAEIERLIAEREAQLKAIEEDHQNASKMAIQGSLAAGAIDVWYTLKGYFSDNSDEIANAKKELELLQAELEEFKKAEESARTAAVDLNKSLVTALGDSASAEEKNQGRILSDDDVKEALKAIDLLYKKKRLAVERDYASGKILRAKDGEEQMALEDAMFHRKASLELDLLTAKQRYYRKDSQKYIDAELKKLEIKRSIEQQKLQLEQARQKAEMSYQYMTGGISYEELQKREVALEEESFQKRISIATAGTTEYKNLLKEYYDWKTQQRAKDAKKSEEALERELKNNKTAISLLFARGEMTETAYSEAIFRAEYDTLQQKLKLYNEGSKEYVEIEKKMQELALDNRNKRLEAEAAYVKRFKETYDMEYMIAEAQRKVQAMRDALKGQPTDKVNKMTDAESKDTADKYIAGSSDSLNPVELYRSQMAAIAELENQSVISHKDAERRKLEASTSMLEQMADIYNEAYEQVSKIVGAVSDYQQAKTALETAKIQSEYDKRIEAAGKNSRKVQKLEKERDAKIAAMKSAANEKAMKIEIAQAIAQTAMGAISAYTSAMSGAPYPANMVLAPISAGIALAAGMMQVATIKKQHQAESIGYASGGFTPGGAWNEPQGVVHSNEFVANRFAVGNSNIAPALHLIDTAQRNNTVGSLTADDVSNVLGGRRSESAAVAAQTVASAQSASAMNAAATAMSVVGDAISELNTQLGKGIYAYTTISGHNGIDEQTKKYNRLKNNAI